ncbi:MAG: primosomal protein N', partial [Coriobacteriia bacterium]|nr:primosomal protein N' [Coriobacteriia bacterium]
MKYADVIVSVAARKIDRPFRYLIPDEEGFEELQIGHLVEVPFGNRTVPGFVVATFDGEESTADAVDPQVDIKPLIQIISGPHFNEVAVDVAQWMSDYYASPLANCLNLFTPPLGRNWRKAVKRRPRHDDELPATEAIRHEHLTAGQQEALDAIERQVEGETILLDGITGSGKTEVYLRAIEDTIEQGKGAIVLVPEISLTPQTVGRFRARFGEIISVLHSRLTEAQRAHQLEQLRQGVTKVVVGPRSALFAPVIDLGMIVIDEEHDGSYKQESDPRYHARKVAHEIARQTGAKLILGSATPSFETLEQVKEGRVTSVELPERVNAKELPPVEVVDMTEEFDAGNRSIFSRALQRSLQDVRDNDQKAIVLLNRRGYANFVLCRECGYVPMCSSCATSLTLHRSHGKLQCHHCGLLELLPPSCP